MEISGMAWQMAQAVPDPGVGQGAGMPLPVPSAAVNDLATDFARRLEAPPGPREAVLPPDDGPEARVPAALSDEVANLPAGGPVTIGDAILRGLSAIGKDITGGWNRLRLPMPVGEGGVPFASEMFTRQVELAVTSFTLEVASKGTGKAVEHVNQIVKQS